MGGVRLTFIIAVKLNAIYVCTCERYLFVSVAFCFPRQICFKYSNKNDIQRLGLGIIYV